MYRIVDRRGTGKTYKLLMLAKENNATVICSNPNALREKAYVYGLSGIDFASYADYATNKVEGRVVIDELENYTRACDSNLIGYTFSVED